MAGLFALCIACESYAIRYQYNLVFSSFVVGADTKAANKQSDLCQSESPITIWSTHFVPLFSPPMLCDTIHLCAIVIIVLVHFVIIYSRISHAYVFYYYYYFFYYYYMYFVFIKKKLIKRNYR